MGPTNRLDTTSADGSDIRTAWLTTRQVAERLGVSRQAVHLADRYLVPARVQVGHRIERRYSPSIVERYREHRRDALAAREAARNVGRR